MTHHRTGSRSRTALAALLAAGITLTAAACGSSSDGKATSSADGVVTITVNDEPPATDPVHRKNFLADVAEFEKLHPKIKIVPHEGQMDPRPSPPSWPAASWRTSSTSTSPTPPD
ncbi:hypothetical protein ACFQZC_01805 [Streptacidiphilus monticola]